MKRVLIATICLMPLVALADSHKQDHVYVLQSLRFTVGSGTPQRYSFPVECDASDSCYYVTRPCEMLTMYKTTQGAGDPVMLRVYLGKRAGLSWLTRLMPTKIGRYSDQEECREALKAKKGKKGKDDKKEKD